MAAKGWFSDVCRNLGLMVHNAKNPDRAVVPESQNKASQSSPKSTSEEKPEPTVTGQTVTETEVDQDNQKVVLRKTTTTVEEIELPLDQLPEANKGNHQDH